MRTCLSSRRRPPSRPAAPVGRGGSLRSPRGWDGADLVLQKDARWIREVQRPAEHRWYAHSRPGRPAWAAGSGGGADTVGHSQRNARPELGQGQVSGCGHDLRSWSTSPRTGCPSGLCGPGLCLELGSPLRRACLKGPALPLACRGDTSRSQVARSSGGRWNQTGCR